MENTRVAILGIIISDMDSVEPVNALLHENSPYIIGRMGLPYREKGINIISIVMDAPRNRRNGWKAQVSLSAIENNAYSTGIWKK